MEKECGAGSKEAAIIIECEEYLKRGAYMKLPQEPDACAVLAGNENYPDLQGTVKFYDTYGGSIVAAEVTGIRNRNGETGEGFLDSISMKERPAAEQERTLLRMQGHTITLRTSRTRSMQETFRRFLYVTERRG